MKKLQINEEFKNLIPELKPEEFEQLEKNIIKEGCRDSLVIWNDTIIDGHNRYKICTKHNIEFTVSNKDFENTEKAKEWIIKNQFGRRNLLLYERAKLALKLKDLIAEKARENVAKAGQSYSPKEGPENSTNLPFEKRIDTREELATIAGTSSNTISKVQNIEEKGTQELKQQLSKGDISINKAYKEIKSAEKKKEREEYIEQQKDEIEKGVAKLPEGKFEIINIDPPWNYGTKYDPNGRRVANPYPEMKQKELMELEIPASDDCILFLWTTHKFIFNAKELLEHWGFKYRNILVWNKEQIGMGNLFRMQCEFCLIGIKGKPLLDNNHKHRDIISEKRREHSRKPEGFYKMVEELCVGRKLDYFSRDHRKDWEVFGNETNKF